MSRPTVLMPGRSSPRAARVMVVAAAVACPMAAVRGADVDVDDLRIEGPRVRFLVEDEESLPPAAGAGGGLLRLFRGFFNPPGNQPPGDPDVPDGADGPMPDDPEKAAAWQQRQQIRQQAAQMTQLFQPTLWGSWNWSATRAVTRHCLPKPASNCSRRAGPLSSSRRSSSPGGR